MERAYPWNSWDDDIEEPPPANLQTPLAAPPFPPPVSTEAPLSKEQLQWYAWWAQTVKESIDTMQETLLMRQIHLSMEEFEWTLREFKMLKVVKQSDLELIEESLRLANKICVAADERTIRHVAMGASNVECDARAQ